MEGPVNEWVVDRHESHTLRRRRPTERAQNKASSARKKSTDKTNEITGALALQASQQSIAIITREPAAAAAAAATYSITTQLPVATICSWGDSPRSIAASPRRRCFLFHFNLLFSLSARLLRERIVRIEFVVLRRKRSERTAWETLRPFGVQSRINVLNSTTVPSQSRLHQRRLTLILIELSSLYLQRLNICDCKILKKEV